MQTAPQRVCGRRRTAWGLGLLLLSLAFVMGAGAKAAYAATTITVDCTTDPGALGGALAGASDGDTLTIQGTCSGTFDIAHSLTLAGSGGATLDGQGAGPVLSVESGQTVVVSDLTITGGNGSAVGGIRNAGTLTLANSTVSGNSVTVPQFVSGVAGIFNQNGSVTLVNSTVSGNSASASVQFTTAIGGIASFNLFGSGSVTLVDSTVSGNSASSPSLAYGGILNAAPGSVAALTNSTVSGNRASATGGASAFSIAAGGIANDGGNLSLTNVTLARNSATEPNGGFLPPAGGISNFDGGKLTVANSLIAQQSDGPNCLFLNPITDAGYNLDNGSSCGFSANGSLSNTDPLLDPAGLQNNGGPTQTIALEPGSPAIDASPPTVNGCGTTITTDQRGVSRPQGSGCDIGAFELVLDSTPPVIAVPGPITVNATSPSGAGVTYTVSATDPDDAVASLSCAPASASTFPIGTTTVTCKASDTHGNTSSATFTVHVKGAAEQLADLGKGVVGVGPGTSLADKVSQVQTYLTANDIADACSTLTALVNELKALSGKTITSGQATTLIATTQRIEAVLGC
jgi:hypothetical protein